VLTIKKLTRGGSSLARILLAFCGQFGEICGKTMEFAVKCVKHVKSNSVVFVKGTRTVGIGGGQTARVDAVWIATNKGKENIKGSTMASDAFFPFRDAVDVAAKAGVRSIIQPGGSIRDEEVIQAANDHGLIMVFSGQRYFKH